MVSIKSLLVRFERVELVYLNLYTFVDKCSNLLCVYPVGLDLDIGI